MNYYTICVFSVRITAKPYPQTINIRNRTTKVLKAHRTVVFLRPKRLGTQRVYRSFEVHNLQLVKHVLGCSINYVNNYPRKNDGYTVAGAWIVKTPNCTYRGCCFGCSLHWATINKNATVRHRVHYQRLTQRRASNVCIAPYSQWQQTYIPRGLWYRYPNIAHPRIQYIARVKCCYVPFWKTSIAFRETTNATRTPTTRWYIDIKIFGFCAARGLNFGSDFLETCLLWFKCCFVRVVWAHLEARNLS